MITRLHNEMQQAMNNPVERRSRSSRCCLCKGWRVRGCTAHSIIVAGWFLFISVLLILTVAKTTTTTASNQHQRIRRSNTYNTNSNNAQQYQYDRSVTTFDPNGQLLQVQYAQYAATQQTYRTIIAMILHNTIYVVVMTTTTKDDDNNNNNNTNEQKNIQAPVTNKKTTNTTAISDATVVTDPIQEEEELQVQQPIQVQQQYMYRISKHIYMIGIGLIGDIRIIAAHLRVEVQQYVYNYDDEISVEIVATILAKLQHTCTYQSGIRPLAVSCFIFGYDPYNDYDDDHHHSPLRLDESDSNCSNRLPQRQQQQQYAKLYKCSPGGIIEDCSYCTSGYNEMEILHHLQEPYHQQWNIHNSSNITKTDDIIEQLVMIIHNSSSSSSNNNNNNDDVLSTMDVWVVQCENQDDSDDRNNTTSTTPPKWKASSQERKSVTCFAGLCIGTNNNNNYDSFMKVRQYYDNNETVHES